MGLLWGILSLQFPGLLSTRERETVLSAFAVRASHLHADLISTKQVHLLQTNTYTVEYLLASRRLHSLYLPTHVPLATRGCLHHLHANVVWHFELPARLPLPQLLQRFLLLSAVHFALCTPLLWFSPCTWLGFKPQ